MLPTVQIKLEIKRTQSVFKAGQVETTKSNLQGSKAKAFFAANKGLVKDAARYRACTSQPGRYK
ncbi:MAG: hypothetical protein GY820_02510 [Gammaproteobacteria bacterium]|nr:hypothetical protein [Gammaproteobacteria bacterium]